MGEFVMLNLDQAQGAREGKEWGMEMRTWI